MASQQQQQHQQPAATEQVFTDATWDAALDLLLRRAMYGTLAGGATALLLLRAPTARATALGIGCGFGLGSAWQQNQELFHSLFGGNGSNNASPIPLGPAADGGTMGLDADVSLRPLSLRPGAGVNPFAGFAKGAGAGLKNKVVSAAPEYTERKKKPPGEIIRYSRDFLMKFVQRYTRVPQELQYSNSDILLAADDPGREQQQQLLQRVAADEADERDWRARSAPPPAPAAASAAAGAAPAAQQQGGAGWRPDQQPAAAPAAGGASGEAAKIQKATDLGRTAWHAGTAVEGSEQTLRKVKGILNKLTPEKFERLLSQLIPLVNSYDVLQGTIRQVFENAVQQPTFVAMYADLCRELDAALPEFHAPGEDRPTGFKKMLANTCQEEYEATEEARKALKSMSGDERDDAERRAKQRLLGNIRLISELFNKEQVNDRIMLLILADLLGAADNDPPEDSLEAVCEVLSTAGAKLEGSPKGKARLDAAFRQLERLSNASKVYASRIRFVVKDVLELRAQHWVARREVFTAKKLEDIRSEAQAELGIVDVPIAGLEALPGAQLLPPLAPKRPEEVELFPAFKSSDAGWAAARGKGEAAGDGKFSAFLGEYVAVPTEAEVATVSGRAPRTDLSPEERESLGKSLFTDYLSSPDLDEAVGTAQELEAPGFMPKLVQLGLEKAFDAVTERDQSAVVELLSALAARGVLGADDLKEGTAVLVEGLEDWALDVPAAPKLLGRLLGSAAASGLLGLDWVTKAAKHVESAEPRRAYVAAALHAVHEAGGDDALRAAVADARLDLPALLQSDPEFNDPDMPPADEFLRQQGLGAVASAVVRCLSQAASGELPSRRGFLALALGLAVAAPLPAAADDGGSPAAQQQQSPQQQKQQQQPDQVPGSSAAPEAAPQAAKSPVPLTAEELEQQAAAKLLEEEEARRKARRKTKGRIRELEELRAELAEKELVLLEKEQELLEKEQTLSILREELEIEKKLRTLLTKEKEKAEEEAALAMGLCTGSSMLP
ncbi:eukaryotic initiation factor [Chlorella sorokiniana]|uniref:Eukaryotic initiation factor n=1 Tax=Chlorella sorokiniana TaxID=3076 RepID=A0A2P6TQR6_CHLSO|nr:eukaryotic initiation factor [Chlorella sorokiniana]|eukprot:PRW56412.1 eukaryotic initiation factor [Chlorella sorokiniana]